MIYPFSAVEGQESFKLALTLSAINPMVGGVLVSGPKGSAKSTLAKAFSEIISVENDKPSGFVDLPLSVSEEMLVGTLSLQDILSDKQVSFQEGLLAKAHGGVLYVDEVNLLPDNIVDLLLDVSVSGVNIVERDGISHKHAAQFILLGTMNPDEGELRPQLKDRFGLYVQLDDDFSVEQRMKIVLEREHFDCNPTEFCAKYQDQQSQLIATIEEARAKLRNVGLDNSLRKLIAQRCIENCVEGMRADIVWYRAAIAHAALNLRDQVIPDDVLSVEELVLGHRRQVLPDANQSNGDGSGKKKDKIEQKPFTRPKSNFSDRNEFSRSQVPETEKKTDEHDNQTSKEKNAHSTDQQKSDVNEPEGAWGKMDVDAKKPSKASSIDLMPFDLNSLLTFHGVKKEHNFNGLPAIASSKKRAKKSLKGNSLGLNSSAKQYSPTVNWFSTLMSNNGVWPLSKLIYKPKKVGPATVNLILLDTSASILSNGAVDKAKAVVKKIGRQAYFNRQALTVIGFGNQTVNTLLSRERAPKEFDLWFSRLSFQGGTPLVDAINHAHEFQKKYLAEKPSTQFNTFVISDGKTTDNLDQLYLQGNVVIIDSESSSVKRGKCQELSDQLGAAYFSLANITS